MQQGCAMSSPMCASGGRQLLLPSAAAAAAVTVPSCAPPPPSSPVPPPPPPPGFLRASSPMTLKQQQPPAVLAPSLSLLPDRAASAVEVGAAIPLQRRSVPDINVPSSGGGGGCANLQLFPQMKRNSYQGDHRMVSMNGSLCQSSRNTNLIALEACLFRGRRGVLVTELKDIWVLIIFFIFLAALTCKGS